MDRETKDDSVSLIDLGVASVETQGLGIGKIDFVAEQNPVAISDD